MKVSAEKRVILQDIVTRLRPLLGEDNWCDLEEREDDDSITIIWGDLFGSICFEGEDDDDVLIYVKHENRLSGTAFQRVKGTDKVPEKTVALLRAYEADLLPEGAVFVGQDPKVRSWWTRS